VCRVTCVLKTLFGGLGAGFGTKPRDWSGVRHPSGLFPATPVCVECLIGKQKKPILFKVTEPSSIPYRTHPACAKMAAYPDPPPVILVPESIAAQAAYQLRYKNTEYYSWVRSGPKCFQVLGLSPSLL